MMNSGLYVVDDNTDHQFLLYKLLKEMDSPWPVTFFDNGVILHKHMRSLQKSTQDVKFPALLLVDFKMPGMNGLQLLKSLKQEPPGPDLKQINEIPVVIMSSYITKAEMEQCYHAGANAVIVKPTDFNLMRKMMRAVCKFWIGM